MVAEGSTIEFTKEEVEALYELLFDTCLYTTSKKITYGNRISAANKIFKAKEMQDGFGQTTTPRKSTSKG